jgi:hypothetical protein
MISELKDDEILEYLMTSDIIENYRPDDYKYLIFKFRSFYKILYGNFQLYKTNHQSEVKSLSISLENTKKELTLTQVERANLQNEIHQISKSRKLTWKERISGNLSPSVNLSVTNTDK